MADTTSTFSVLLRLRDELSAALGKPIAGMGQLQAATKGSAVILDGFGRPAAAAGAALEHAGKKAKDLADTKLADLRRGAASTTQVMTGLLGATHALPPGFSAAASGMNGLLGAFAAGFGPLGIAVAAISTVAGLAYALSNQLTPAARTAEEVLKTTASAAERLANARLGSLGDATKALAGGSDKELAAMRQRLELQQRLDQARLTARAATVRADTSLTDEERTARLAAEDLAQRTEATRAQLELARAEEAVAKDRLDTLQQIVEQQKDQARIANATALGFARQRETIDADLVRLRRARATASSSSSSGIPVPTPEIDAQIARLEKLRGNEGEAEQKRLQRMAAAEAEAAASLKTELDGAADAYKRAATARTQLEAAAPDILAAQASEIHAANRAEQEQLRLRAQSRARAEEQLALDRRLAAIAQERSEIEGDRLISAEDKQARLNRLLDQENALLQDKLTKLDAIIAAERDPALRLELTRDRDQTAGRVAANRGARAADEPLDVRGQIGADIVSMTDEWGTKAERVAQIFTGPLRAGLRVAHDGMQRLLGTTEYWTAKLGNVAGPIMGAVTSAIAGMFTQWIAGRIKQSAVHLGLVKAEGATETAAKTPGALLSSISSFGVAAAVGVAALVAALAAFEGGGRVKGGQQLIRVNESGEEYVVRAPAVEHFGSEFLDKLNAGVLDLAALPDDIAVAMPRATSPRQSGPTTNSQLPPSASAPAPTLNANFALLNTRQAFREFMRQEGSKMAYDYSTKRTVRA